jgi:hypothetical protein
MKLLPLLVATAAAILGEPDLIAPLDPRGIEIARRLSKLELRICARVASTCFRRRQDQLLMGADGSLDNSGTTGGKR